MILTVNGVDLTRYIKDGGFKWSLNDLDSDESGRTLDGLMYRGRVATKRKLEIVCRPLTSQQASIVLNAILPEFVTVVVTDPLSGGNHSMSMYCSTRPANLFTSYRNGQEVWDNISFNLIER